MDTIHYKNSIPVVISLFLFFFVIPGVSILFSKLFLILLLPTIYLFYYSFRKSDDNIFLMRSPFEYIALATIISVLITWLLNGAELWQFIGNGNTLTPIGVVALTVLFFGAVLFIRKKGSSMIEDFISSILGIAVISYSLIIIGSYIYPPFFQPIVAYNLFIGEPTQIAIMSVLGIVLNIRKQFSSTKDEIISGIIIGFALANLIIINIVWLWWILVFGVLISIIQNNRLLNEVKVKQVTIEPILLLISILMILSSGMIGSTIQNKAGISYIDVSPSLQTMVNISENTLRSESVIFGNGSTQFDALWQEVKNKEVNNSLFWNTRFSEAMSTFTGLLPLYGVIGLFLGILSIVIIISFLKKDSFILNRYSFVAILIILSGFISNIGIVVASIGVLAYALMTEEWGKKYMLHTEVSPYHKNISFILSILIVVCAIVSFSWLTRTIQAISYINDVMAVSTDNKAESERLLITSLAFADIPSTHLMLANLYDNQIVALMQQEVGEESKSNIVSIIRNLIANEITSTKKAIEQAPRDFDMHVAHGQALSRATEFGIEDAHTQSLDAFDQALKLSPNNPAIYLEKAKLMIVLEDYEKARELIAQAFELKPDYVDAALVLAQIEIRSNNTTEALNIMEQSIQIQPNNALLRFQTGLMRYDRGEYRQALIHFKNAYELQPTFDNSAYLYALSAYNNGDPNEALRVITVLLERHPTNQELLTVKENIQYGREPFSNLTPPSNQEPTEREELPLLEEEQQSI